MRTTQARIRQPRTAAMDSYFGLVIIINIIIIIIHNRCLRAAACDIDFQFTYLGSLLVSDTISNFRFCLRFQRISPIIMEKATSIPTPNTIYTSTILFKLIRVNSVTMEKNFSLYLKKDGLLNLNKVSKIVSFFNCLFCY